jgi:hypothetical protein
MELTVIWRKEVTLKKNIMKRYLWKNTNIYLILIGICIGILLVGASSEQTLKKGGVISINSLTFVLKPDVPLYEFVDFMIKKHIPEFEKNFPGVKEYLLWGDKGVNKYQLAVMEVYGSVAMR